MLKNRVIGSTLVISVFALTLCGAGLLILHSHGDGHVAGCPFADTMDASCPLSTIDQLSKFTTVLGVLPINTIFPILLSLLLGLSCAIIASIPLVPPRPSQHRREIDAVAWRPLHLAFSRGILNPKPF